MEEKKRTLADMLLEHAGKPGSGLAAKNFATFMAHWDEIRDAHDQGWSYSDIWKTLRAEGILNFSYPAFTKYVRKATRQRPTVANDKKQNGNIAANSEQSSAEPNRKPPGYNNVVIQGFGTDTKPGEPRRF